MILLIPHKKQLQLVSNVGPHAPIVFTIKGVDKGLGLSISCVSVT